MNLSCCPKFFQFYSNYFWIGFFKPCVHWKTTLVHKVELRSHSRYYSTYYTRQLISHEYNARNCCFIQLSVILKIHHTAKVFLMIFNIKSCGVCLSIFELIVKKIFRFITLYFCVIIDYFETLYLSLCIYLTDR